LAQTLLSSFRIFENNLYYSRSQTTQSNETTGGGNSSTTHNNGSIERGRRCQVYLFTHFSYLFGNDPTKSFQEILTNFWSSLFPSSTTNGNLNLLFDSIDLHLFIVDHHHAVSSNDNGDENDEFQRSFQFSQWSFQFYEISNQILQQQSSSSSSSSSSNSCFLEFLKSHFHLVSLTYYSIFLLFDLFFFFFDLISLHFEIEKNFKYLI